MTVTKEGAEPEFVVNATPEPAMVTAIGVEETTKPDGVGGRAGGKGNEPPIPPGHSRFYCNKCRAVSSWFMFLWMCCDSSELVQEGRVPISRRCRKRFTDASCIIVEQSTACGCSFKSHLFNFPPSICQSYDLPDGATSWRCAGCHTFNSTQPGECEWCSIL